MKALLVFLLMAVPVLVMAQDVGGFAIPLKVVDGHLVVAATLITESGDENDVSLQVSFARPEVLVLHGDQHEWLRQGKARLLLQPDLEVWLTPDEVKPESRPSQEPAQNRITRLYASALKEAPLKGTLGIGFLRRYGVTVDIPAGKLTLKPPGADALAGGQAMAFEFRDDRVWLPLIHAGGKTGRLLLGGEEYDTTVNSRVAREMGKPAGDIGSARMAWPDDKTGIELAGDFAFRPRPFAEDDDRGNDSALLVAGVNLFEVFRVEIDWEASRIAFTRQREARYPQEDFEFFKAETVGKPDEFLAYLRRYPDTRLSEEAAAGLMKLRLEDRGSDDELVEALQWIVDTAPVDRRLENCMEYLRGFAAMPGRSALVQRAGALALKNSRGAVTVQDTYRLHNMIGESLLAAGALEEAWAHFLSAAFMPLDNAADLLHNLSVNLNLARVYDRQDRYVRAYSRYKKAQALMNVKVRDRPTLAEVAAMPDDPAMTAARREYVDSARRSQAEIDTALKRLRPKIPPGNRVLLEG